MSCCVKDCLPEGATYNIQNLNCCCCGKEGSGGQNDGLAPGFINYFAGDMPPAGWLKADGAEVSRTTYTDLFAAIGTIYGEGDGESTFNLPDLRGEFLRGFDDGRGIDDERVFGSAQGDAMRNFTGEVGWKNFRLFTVANGVFEGITTNVTGEAQILSTGSSWPYRAVTLDPSRVVPTADENRPRNVALLACIKY